MGKKYFSIISAFSIKVRSYLDRVGRKIKNKKKLSDFTKTIIVFVSALIVGTIVYLVMYLLFGFGGGMLTSVTKPRPLTKIIKGV